MEIFSCKAELVKIKMVYNLLKLIRRIIKYSIGVKLKMEKFKEAGDFQRITLEEPLN